MSAVLLAALLSALCGCVSSAPVPKGSASAHDDELVEAAKDVGVPAEKVDAATSATANGRPATYPLIAQCAGIDVRSPVAPADLTGVLFHQASLPYALVMTTELPTADIEAAEAGQLPRMNAGQLEGEWLDAEALHLWREADTTDMDTSIDVGAPAGTVVRSPVSGTVVLVKDYMLYDELPDIEIHIQPVGRPDLDVVLIHTYDPYVKAGDKVEAGATELSHVRDIAAHLDDVQLGFYTAEGDPGNHAHVQVNDANYEGYREKKLEGALEGVS